MFRSIISSLFLCLFAASSGMAASFGIYSDISYNGIWNVDSEEEVYSGFRISGVDEMEGMGLSLGTELRLPLDSNFSIQGAMLFTYRSRTGSVGIELDADDQVQSVLDVIQALGDFSIRQILVEFPLMLRYEASNRFFTAAGPVTTINVNSQIDAGAISLVGNNLISDLTISGMVTLGRVFPLSSGRLDVGVSLQLSITSVISDDIEIPGFPIAIDGTNFMDPRDLIVRVGMTYWFI